jgi:hypothetical protein
MTEARKKFEESQVIAGQLLKKRQEKLKRIEDVLWKWFGQVAKVEPNCVEEVLRAAYYLED